MIRWRWIEGIFGTIGVLAVLTVVGWLVYQAGYRDRSNETTPINTSGTTSTAPETKSEETRTLTEYRSRQGVIIKLDPKLERETLGSPLIVSGEVPGNWSFEASFPIELRDSAGTVLDQTIGTLEGDWMTTNHVPFTATLNFTAPASAEVAQLILMKDNPSDLPEHDDDVMIPVKLSPRK
jgi:hypothetical protein